MNINGFSFYGDIVILHRKNWDKAAVITLRNDYIDEITSVVWTKNGDYLYNKSLGMLHIYIIKKWYGDIIYNEMKSDGFIVEHIDNNGFNCTIENLTFLSSDDNKAKGFTLDKQCENNKRYIALTISKNFTTQYYQISIVFNYNIKINLSSIDKPAVVELAFLLYPKDIDYRIVINDARSIMLEYEIYKSFSPEKLNYCDYHIEGRYDNMMAIETYERYLNGEFGQ